MKNKYFMILSLLALIACEDVVDIETPSEPPRLIVDALIRVDTSVESMRVKIKLRQTSSFFEAVPAAKADDVTIFRQPPDGEEPDTGFIQFIELEPGSGIYEPSGNEVTPDEISTSFFTRPGTFFLSISYKDEIFLARTPYVPAVPIDSLAQGDDTLFEDDETEVIVSFTDEPDRDDFYLLDLDFDEFLVTEDEFYQGQPFSFSYFYEDGIAPGTQVVVSLLGVDREFHNYMALLIDQSGQDFGPFETPAVTARGNILNVTDIDNIDNFDNVNMTDNFALGYFAISETFKDSIVIQERQ